MAKKTGQKPQKLFTGIQPKAGRTFTVALTERDKITLKRPAIDGCWSQFTAPNGDVEIKWLPKQST